MVMTGGDFQLIVRFTGIRSMVCGVPTYLRRLWAAKKVSQNSVLDPALREWFRAGKG
jgi:hypothetical protein